MSESALRRRARTRYRLLISKTLQNVRCGDLKSVVCSGAIPKAKKRGKGHADRGSSMWTLVMNRARKQAERYAQAIPGDWPPFLVVVDVGHCIQLYADFTQE